MDYCGGNAFFTRYRTMDDMHKPELDQIGFQELITDEMAAWSTKIDATTGEPTYSSIGLQPAYMELQTAVSETFGNFASIKSEGFMTLQRLYTPTEDFAIGDATTYIDPAKFNACFATQDLASQHFWPQLGFEVRSNRLMAAGQMPRL